MLAERTLAGVSPASVPPTVIQSPISPRSDATTGLAASIAAAKTTITALPGGKGEVPNVDPVGDPLDHQAGDILTLWDDVVACRPTVSVPPGPDGARLSRVVA